MALLASDHAPLVIGFLHPCFVRPNVRALSEHEATSGLDDYEPLAEKEPRVSVSVVGFEALGFDRAPRASGKRKRRIRSLPSGAAYGPDSQQELVSKPTRMMKTQQPMPAGEHSATETSVSQQDTHRRLASLTRYRVSIELSTLDVCFLAALQLRADTDALASFEEDLVLDVFDQVCDLVEPGIENRRQRANYTIQRLRTQRMLARVDAMGIISAGEYALTILGALIVRSFLEDERLSRESLALLTGGVISSLAQIRTSAQRACGEAEWRAQVVAPLRVTVGDLIGGIERRQRGLDTQQEEVRDQIGELLQADWFGAAEQCQILLETTAGTLRELNEVLLRASSQIQSLLQEIQQSAAAARDEQAEEAAQRVAEQVHLPCPNIGLFMG